MDISLDGIILIKSFNSQQEQYCMHKISIKKIADCSMKYTYLFSEILAKK